MAREIAADEIFCRSCGEPIKREAEICPECGVRNEKANSTSGGGQVNANVHDPSQYETTVSDTWWYGIAIGTVLWILLLIASSTLNDTGALVGIVTLIAWILMPVAVYFDMQYIRANGQWNPNTILWIVAMVIFFVNIVAGVVYLYRRHEVLGIP